jgi:hypothetical protein
MTAAFTPGPWTARANAWVEDDENEWYVMATDEAIATGLAKSDAALIAAAPDLAAANKHAAMALRSLARHDLNLSERSIVNAALSVLDAALAKIEAVS